MGDVKPDMYASYVSSKLAFERSYEPEAYERWSRNAYRQVAPWLPQSRDARILDAACGHGNVLHMLVRAGYTNVEGVDISEEQVELARRVSPHVLRGDVLAFLEGKVSEYDLIFGFDIIEHFQKAEVLRFLRASFEALTPGGSLILQTPNASSPFGSGLRYGDFTHELAFDGHALAHVLRVCGFENIDLQETGPVVHGPKSAMRWFVWRGVRLALQVWNVAETGHTEPVLTRVFRARARRP